MPEGRAALVTGAARGIGAATVDVLVASGYRVMALDAGGDVRPAGVEYDLASREQLEALRERHGDAVLTRAVDVRDLEALKAAAADTVQAFGRLDAAVAAAAVLVGGAPLWETPADHLRTLLDIDVVGVWNTAAAVVPHMLAGPDPSGCRFVAVASTAGEQGLFRLAGYNAAKHAVIGIVRGLAADLVATGVTAVAVAPGSTDTDMLAATAQLYGVPVEQLAESQQQERLLLPAEVAAIIADCCAVGAAAPNGSVVQATGEAAG
jgi:SDR family mycofactocin-dependent oxidoreductase